MRPSQDERRGQGASRDGVHTGEGQALPRGLLPGATVQPGCISSCSRDDDTDSGPGGSRLLASEGGVGGVQALPLLSSQAELVSRSFMASILASSGSIADAAPAATEPPVLV